MKIKFLTDYSPRKKGEVLEATTREEIKLANWYVDNGLAKLCTCSELPNGCPDCEKKAAVAKGTEVVFVANRDGQDVEIYNADDTTVKEIKAELDKRKISYSVTGRKPYSKTELFELIK